MSKYQNEVESVSDKEADEQQHANAFQYFKSFIPVDIPWVEGDPSEEWGAPLPCETYPFGCLELMKNRPHSRHLDASTLVPTHRQSPLIMSLTSSSR